MNDAYGIPGEEWKDVKKKNRALKLDDLARFAVSAFASFVNRYDNPGVVLIIPACIAFIHPFG